ncbi:MAG: PASTA domain-containing protein [Prevotella sp.]|nr:PASTA domain-containing protein [Prevotella sp.]
MQPKEFFHKLMSRYLWLNLMAMVLLVVVLALGVHVALNIYTHHGESISVPDVRRQSFESAQRTMENHGFTVEVNDTGYVKTLPAGTVLEQMPAAGTRLKAGRVIYLTINAANSPTLALPDLIDNSSLREAQAKLTAMGFKLAAPRYVPGEKDWVYGIQAGGRSYTTGQRVPVDALVTILVGNGHVADDEDLLETDAPSSSVEEDFDFDEGGGSDDAPEPNTNTSSGEKDDFEVVE